MAAPSVDLNTTAIYGPGGSGGDNITPVAPTLDSAGAADSYSTTGFDDICAMSHSTSVDELYGMRVVLTTGGQDLTAEQYVVFCARWTSSSYPTPARNMAPIDSGGARILFFDGSGNWSSFYWHGEEYDKRSIADDGWEGFVNPGSIGAVECWVDITRTPDATSGTLDWTDIDGWEVHLLNHDSNTATVALGVGMVSNTGKSVMVGGETGDKATLNHIVDAETSQTGNYDKPNSFRSLDGLYAGLPGQLYQFRKSVAVGDGSATTEWEEDGFTFVWGPNRDDARATMPHYLGGTENRVLRRNASSTDLTALTNFQIYGSADDDIEFTGSTAGTHTLTTGLLWGFGLVTLSYAQLDTVTLEDIDRVEITSDTGMVNGVLRNCATDGLVIIGAPGDFSALTCLVEDTNTGNQLTIEPTSAGTFDLSGLTVQAGHTLAIRNNSATHNITVQLATGITTSTSTAGGTITIDNAATVSVKVTATSDAGLVQNARVRLEAASGGPAIAGTVLLEGLTDVNGELEDTGYVFTTDQPVVGTVRKSSGSPYYVPGKLGGSITSSGYNTETFLILD